MTSRDTASTPQSDRKVIKGRGAVNNPHNRYQTKQTLPFHDGWETGTETETKTKNPAIRTLRIRERSKTIITSNRSPDIPFDRSINPYRGCEHGCIYCYARPTHAYWDMSPGLDFETKIIVREGAAELLRKKLDDPKYQVSPICIGANTDPYQPVEASEKSTRSLIEVLAEYRHPFTLITKSHLVTRDIDLLAPLAEDNLCSVAVSVTTLDNDLKRILEPRTPSGSTRLKVIEALSSAGINVTLLAAPMIPYINDNELETILGRGRQAGAVSARYILIRLPLEISEMFQEWLKAHFPDRAGKVMSVIRQSRGGQDYQTAFGTRMTGTGEFADLMRHRWSISCRRLGYQNEDARIQLDTTQFKQSNKQLVLF